MNDAALAQELRELHEQHADGELDTAEYARLRERLVLRAAAAESGQQDAPRTGRAGWAWALAVIVAAVVVSAALLPAVRERAPGAGITGNDQVDAGAGATAAVAELRAADEALSAGRLSEAIRGYRQAVTAVPDEPEPRVRLGVALAEAGQFTEAVNELRMAVRADPRRPNTRIYLGGVLLRAGRRDEAAAQWRHYLRLAPDGEAAPVVRRSLRQLRKRGD